MTDYRVPNMETFSYQVPVLDKDLTSPPGASKGDRYLIYGTGSGDWSGLDGKIVTYTGSVWTPVTPVAGMMVFVVDELKYYKYLTTWAEISNMFKLVNIYADQFENPVNADWAVNSLAPVDQDDVNNASKVRAFDDGTTEEGVGFSLKIPLGTTSINLAYISKAKTAPAGARTVGLKLYYRRFQHNTALPAWANYVLADVDITTNAYYQVASQSFLLTAPTTDLVAGEEYQFQLVRPATPVGGTELVGDWFLRKLEVSFI